MSVAHLGEIAASAARLVVEDGMEYAEAKRKAARALARNGSGRGVELPSNEQVETEVREYLDLFCADSQPGELQALRELAAVWMSRLSEFRPHLGGAVWRGTATRLSAIHIDLYCDDAKAAEIALLNRGIAFDLHSRPAERGGAGGPRGQPLDVLSVSARCAGLADPVTIFLTVRDHDDLRGALKPDAHGRTWRGDAVALQRLLDAQRDAQRDAIAPHTLPLEACR